MPVNKKTFAAKNIDEFVDELTSGRRKPDPGGGAARIVLLSELGDGQEGEFFALLSEKQELKTRDGKPYFRVTFRDAKRDVSFPIWSDSPLAEPCRNEWQPGQ